MSSSVSDSAKSDYGYFSRLIHRIALDLPFVAEASFDFEQARTKVDVAEVVAQKHVFISGLARAGTTILMRRFHATGRYRSLTYRDMPFVLMPNLWKQISGNMKKGAAKERAHGDAILVDTESPEALEEVFWRIFSKNAYLFETALKPMTADDELIAKFQQYIALILADKTEPNRYLSKNNNNILRLGSIRQAFPDAVILVPFRKPLQQAQSLWRQHRLFCQEQQQDAFIQKYMEWLAHHEFGLSHRPFQFENSASEHTDPDQLNYWLERWLTAYQWLSQQSPKGTLFVAYETLCTQTQHVWEALATVTDLQDASPADADTLALRDHPIKESVDDALVSQCDAVYDTLCDKALI